MIVSPDFDPVLIALGPLSIKWYSITYLIAVITSCYLLPMIYNETDRIKIKPIALDLGSYGMIGIIIGARIGYVLIYNLQYYIQNPIEIIMLNHGGMSFHGGAIGFIITVYILSKRYKIKILQYTDIFVFLAPIFLFMGRITNFINSELYGRVTDVPWAVVFPKIDQLPRHPSQIYEAIAEGLFLGIIMAISFKKLRHITGFITAIFCIGYGVLRFFVEIFREPEIRITILNTSITMGQLLSLMMIVFGTVIAAIVHTRHVKNQRE